MKKQLLTLLISLFTIGFSQAQSAWDGLRYSQNYYGGTARFTAMGGAFTALGGDFSALSVNPAGIGVFRNYDLSITPAITYNVTDATYVGNTISDSYTRFGFDNIGFAFNVYNGNDFRFNIGLGYNKVNQTVNRTSVEAGPISGHTVNPDGSVTLGSAVAGIAIGADGISAGTLDLPYPQAYNTIPVGKWDAIMGWKTFAIDLDPTTRRDDEYIGATEYVDGTGAVRMQGAVNQSYYSESYGSTGEYLLSFGGNCFDEFYFGINVGIQNVWNYNYQNYTERTVNSADFDTGFDYMNYESELTTRGTGVNIKLGVIWRPTGGLRWGAYFHSPTWLYLTDEYSAGMSTHFINPPGSYPTFANEETPLNVYDYRVNTPVKWGTGLAYVIGSSAIISVEYEGQDYGATTMLGRNGQRYKKLEYMGDDPQYRYEDDYTRKNFGMVTNIRAGAEYRLEQLSFRAGYAYYSSPLKNSDSMARNIFSAGLGYRNKNFYVDGTYSFTPNNNSSYTIYTNSAVVDADSFGGKINITLGFRL